LLLREKERRREKAEIAGLLSALELKADCVTEMDGDFSHHPRYLSDFLMAMKHFDVFFGSWMRPPGGRERGRSAACRIITKTANLYIRISFHTKIKDSTSGFRCSRREVLGF
jgi:dolichol-phosphate mannosyltransferase